MGRYFEEFLKNIFWFSLKVKKVVGFSGRICQEIFQKHFFAKNADNIDL